VLASLAVVRLNRASLVVFGSLAAAILAVIGLERLLDSGGSSARWAEAITAVATVVLVIVTGVYVSLTARLNPATGEEPRRANAL
jgi:hypothetical protein